jgi:hypothetical protein
MTLKKIDKKLLYFTIIILALSGLSIFIITDYMAIETEYGMRVNPLLDEAKLVHNFITMFFVLVVGKVLDSHILKGIKNKHRKYRKTGLTLTVLIVVLTISSPFMFYITNETYLPLLKNIHLITGILFSIFFIAHIFLVNKKQSHL